MTHIFISYSRKDLAIAEKIINALAKDDLEPWIDWKSIPKGEEFEREIYKGIESAEIFLLLVSPDSIKSEWCNREIAHAVLNGKRILPIVIRDTDTKNFHPEILKRNWIFCRDGQDDFNKALEETRNTILTDYEWLRFHTELLVKTLKWYQKKDTSRLLRGKELREAEQQLAEINSQEDPQPTSLQRGYILASQRNEIHIRQQTTIGLIIGLGIMVVLSFVAWGQRNSAVSAQNTAIAEGNARSTAQAESNTKRLIALANSKITVNFNQALLLGVQSYKEEKKNDIHNSRSRELLLLLLQHHPGLVKFLPGHNDLVHTVAYSPDARLAASGGNDNKIILWNVSKRNSPIKQSVLGLTSPVNTVSFSPDSDILVAGTVQGSIALWDVSKPEDPKPLITFVAHSGSIVSVAFSPNGKLLASGGRDTQIYLWDISDPAHPKKKVALPSQKEGAGYVSFSPDGKTLISGGFLFNPEDKNKDLVILYDISKLNAPVRISAIPLPEKLNDIGTFLNSLTESGDGRILAFSVVGETYLWNIANPLEPFQITQITGSYAEISPDGNYLATADNNILTIWDISKLPQVAKVLDLEGHADQITCITFSPDGKSLISGSIDRNLIFWNNDSQSVPLMISAIANHWTISDLSISPDGKLLAYVNTGKLIPIWDISDPTNPTHINDLKGHDEDVLQVSFSPDGKILASLSGDNNVILWDISHPDKTTILSTIIGNSNPAMDIISFSPNGDILAIGNHDGSIKLWDVSSPVDAVAKTTLIGHTDFIMSLSFSPDSKVLATSSWDKTVIIWNVDGNSYKRSLTLEGHADAVGTVSFNPVGDTLVSGGKDESILVWRKTDTRLFDKVKTLNGHFDDVNKLLFDYEGNLLFSGGEDGNILLWDFTDPNSPLFAGTIFANSRAIRSMQTSRDGKILVTGHIVDDIILWDIDPESWLTKACGMAGRNFTQDEWQQFFPGEYYRITCPQYPAGE